MRRFVARADEGMDLAPLPAAAPCEDVSGRTEAMGTRISSGAVTSPAAPSDRGSYEVGGAFLDTGAVRSVQNRRLHGPPLIYARKNTGAKRDWL